MENVNNDTLQLIRVIEKYSDEVNTRRNDPVSSAKRRKAWDKICQEYNHLPGVRPRTILQIRRFIHGRRYRSRKSSVDEERVPEKEGTSTDQTDNNRLSDSADETDEAPNEEAAEEGPAPTDELEEFAAGRGIPFYSF